MPKHSAAAKKAVASKHKPREFEGRYVYDPRAEIVREVHLPIVTGMSQTACWRHRQAGDFPPAIQLTKRAIGFRRSDLEAWLKRRELARSA
jgi:predicted DNA-binding transcriptional regulator AlpA